MENLKFCTVCKTEIASDSEHCIKCGTTKPFSETNAIKRAEEEFVSLHRNVYDFLKTGINLWFSLLLSTSIVFILAYTLNPNQLSMISGSISTFLYLSKSDFEAQYYSGIVLCFISLISWVTILLITSKFRIFSREKTVNKNLNEKTQLIRIFLGSYQEDKINEDTIKNLNQFNNSLSDAKKRPAYKDRLYDYTFSSKISFITEYRVYMLVLMNLIFLFISCYILLQTSSYLSAIDNSNPVIAVRFFIMFLATIFVFSSIFYFNANYDFTASYRHYINNLQKVVSERMAGEKVSLPFSGYVMASHKSYVPKYS